MKTIFEELKAIQLKSYSPYSKYPVGCVLIGDDNHRYYGVNVENAALGLTTCAERSALVNAVTNGVKHIKHVHIICGKDMASFGVPCGSCRQILAEFMTDEDLISVWNKDGEEKCYKFKELLPHCFRSTFFAYK